MRAKFKVTFCVEGPREMLLEELKEMENERPVSEHEEIRVTTFVVEELPPPPPELEPC